MGIWGRNGWGERKRKGGERGDLLEPALDRSPPTEAVAMIEPEGEGLEDEV